MSFSELEEVVVLLPPDVDEFLSKSFESFSLLEISGVAGTI